MDMDVSMIIVIIIFKAIQSMNGLEKMSIFTHCML